MKKKADTHFYSFIIKLYKHEAEIIHCMLIYLLFFAYFLNSINVPKNHLMLTDRITRHLKYFL